MSNAFASYGSAAAPQFKSAKPAKQPSALDLKMQEKQRLSKRYRQWKREQTKATLAVEPRLAGFMRYLRSINADNGGELIDAIAGSWLPCAPQPVRLFALRMVHARCEKINRQLGFEGLDDPLPPQSSIYFRARDILYEGGRV